HQYRGLAVVDFATFEEQPDFTHAWFPVAEFDESAIEGNLAVGRSERGAVVLIGSGNLHLVGEGPSAGVELRQQGRKTRWLVRVCEASDIGAAQTRYGSLSVAEAEDGGFVVDDPDYGRVLFHEDGSVEAEDRRIAPADFSVTGEVTMLSVS
ncbi:hypothetical protein AB4144_39195, partial [Rhizobiaceae sp. 2RAB30]